ncbi:MAG: cation:proton antiporter [Planctomycetota bacterium]
MTSIWEPLFGIIVLLALAMTLGSIAERLKQSAIVGFMLAGLLLGPNVLGAILGGMEDVPGVLRAMIDPGQITAIADLGVTLLMFTIGLEFSWSRLRRLGVRAIATGVTQIGSTMAAVVAISQLLNLIPGVNLSVKAGVALGAVFSLSSTGVVMPALARRSEVDSVHGRFALGILLVQDIAVIPLVLVVAALGGEGTVGQVLLHTAGQFGIVAAFVAGAVLFVKFVVPRVVAFNAPTGNREVTVLFAIVVSLGAAWGANRLGLSPALGAFIAAIFLGESLIAPRLRGDVGPLKTIFVTLFFASIGMLGDPAWIVRNLAMVAVALALLLLVKPTLIWATGRVFRLAHRHAIAAGVCMGQVGVFSFVLARSAQDGGVISAAQFDLVVSITILTLFLTPYLVAFAPTAGARGERLLRRWGLAKVGQHEDAALNRELASHIVVVGFGPAGRAVAHRMQQSGSTVVVVDLNPASIRAAREAGMRGVLGDATAPELLKQVHIGAAEALVLTVPDHRLSMAIIVEARELAPDLQIVARSRYHRYVELLSATGASVVVDEEAHVGDRLSETLRLKVRTDSERDHERIREEPAAAEEPKLEPATADQGSTA